MPIPAVPSSSRPTIAVSIPSVSTRIAPKRLTIRAVTPSDRIPTVTVQGMNASPVCSAL